MHLPSAAKLWQMPLLTVFPTPVPELLRLEPLEVQAASYLAESDKILSFSLMSKSSFINISDTFSLTIERLFDSIIAHTFECVKREI